MKLIEELRDSADEVNKEDFEAASSQLKKVLLERAAKGLYHYRADIPSHLLPQLIPLITEDWGIEIKIAGQFTGLNSVVYYSIWFLWSAREEKKIGLNPFHEAANG